MQGRLLALINNRRRRKIKIVLSLCALMFFKNLIASMYLRILKISSVTLFRDPTLAVSTLYRKPPVIGKSFRKPAIEYTLEKIDQQQRSKDRNDQWQRRKSGTTFSMQLLKQVFKEEIRNFMFNLLFEKASCKFGNYFRMYRKYCKKVFISGDLVPLTTPGKGSGFPIYRLTLCSLLSQ